MLESNPCSMRRWLAVLLLLLVALPACAAAGYTVSPVGDDYIPDRPPQDLTPLEWWQVPPQILISSYLIGTSPELLVVVNLLFLLNVWLFFGYRRITKRAALEHETRTAIYDHICAHPGIRLGTLIQDLGANRGTVRYHLGRLQEFGMIATAVVEGQTGYFENRQKYSALEAKVLIHLRNPTTQEILAILLESPAISRRELAQRLGITASSVSWHLQRLKADGIVLQEKMRGDVRYSLSEESAMVIRERAAGGLQGTPRPGERAGIEG